MSGTNNPFQTPDFGLPSQEPGLLGVSPATWANIAALGAGAIQGANQRTGSGHLANGTGLAGGIAGAAQGYLGSVNQGAQLRSQIAHQGAQTQTLNYQNQIQQAQLPFQLQIAQQNADFAQNPQHARDWLNQFTQGQGQQDQSPNPFTQGAFSPPPPGGATYGSVVNGKEGTGHNPTPGVTAQGVGQLNDASWNSFVSANPQRFQGMTPQQIQAARSQDLGQTEWLARQNAPILARQGVQPNGPNLGLAHFLGPQGAVAIAKAPADAPVSSVLAGALGPETAQTYVEKNPQLGALTVGGLRNRYANVPSISDVSPWAINQSQNLGNRADALAFAQKLGLNIPGDPAFTRSQALEYTKAGLAPLTAGAEELAKGNVALQVQPKLEQAKKDIELQYAGALEREKARNSPFIARPGSAGEYIDNDGTRKSFKVPEIVQTQNEQGQTVPVHVAPALLGAPAGTPGSAEPILGPDGKQIVGKQDPGTILDIEQAAKLRGNTAESDRKEVDETLSHVLDGTNPTKTRLLELRQLNPDVDAGANGELRARLKNILQTYAPDLAKGLGADATPAQIYQKLALVNSGSQEKETLGARGSFRAIELFLRQNPSLENQPDANAKILNAQLIWTQQHQDYASGAVPFYHNQYDQAGKLKSTANYQPLSKYDAEYNTRFKPELYASAIAAINGGDYATWSKGLTPSQQQIVGGIVQRADPSAILNIGGRHVPASDLGNTFAPQDVIPGVR